MRAVHATWPRKTCRPGRRLTGEDIGEAALYIACNPDESSSWDGAAKGGPLVNLWIMPNTSDVPGIDL